MLLKLLLIINFSFNNKIQSGTKQMVDFHNNKEHILQF